MLESFHIGSQSRTFGTIWQHRQVLPLITDKLSLLVNYRVKLTGTSREECVGLTILTLKLGGSIAPSSRPFQLAACVLSIGQKFCVDTATLGLQWRGDLGWRQWLVIGLDGGGMALGMVI